MRLLIGERRNRYAMPTVFPRIDCHQAAGFPLRSTTEDLTGCRLDATDILPLPRHFPLGEVRQLLRIPAHLDTKPQALIVEPGR